MEEEEILNSVEDDEEEEDEEVSPDDEDSEEDGDTEDDSEDESQDDEEEHFAGNDSKVTLPDGSVTTVGELVRGNLREKDYTRKTQEIAANRKELETRHAALAQQEQVLDLALEITLASIPEEPSNQLLMTNPMAYWQHKAIFDQRMQEVAGLIQTKQQMSEAQEAQQTQAFSQWAEVERDRAVELMPELRNKEVVQRFNNDIIGAVSKYGFNEEDVAGIFDHRFLLLARDVIEYQKIMANKPKAVQKMKGKPPLSPTSKGSTNKPSMRSDLDRLRKSQGKDTDALDRVLDKFL
ncbi:hypothetical protein CU103_12335 [Phyllobacterium sophorae]|uniref:Scaffolding protein n=2 Tax=Phyllobacterium sophorae TaxID=1520277 RepID=A0A2P7BDV9_9HYPH|nr:hypothetical protein CU103_12335 [Phyllobacterium sophorae]